jgi:hypothetical protein
MIRRHLIVGDTSFLALAHDLRRNNAEEPCAQRAIHEALAQLMDGAVWVVEFDHLMMSILPEASPRLLWTDGEDCTCAAHGETWCLHRVLYHVVLAQIALHRPRLLHHGPDRAAL